ncbi:MAG: 4Fe-4S binding protein [Eggerthellaceae bacterium]|nr:4Fe-4S binding protein [Eggerthellaceae bacterium]
MPDLSTFEDWKPGEFPKGLICNGGTSVEYITGGWRSMRPVWDESACTSCMLCWVVCPDSSIQVKDGKMEGIDYDHCKGCGVCVHECRFGALDFIREDEAEGVK